jgi:hypothetical protein
MTPLIILISCLVALAAFCFGLYWHTPYEPKRKDPGETEFGDEEDIS